MLTNFLRNYGARAICQVLVAIANFAIVQVAGRVLPVAEFGRYALALAVNGFVMLTLFQPITESLNRFVSEAGRAGRRAELQRCVARLTLGASAVTVIAYLVITAIVTSLGLFKDQITGGLAIIALVFFVTYSLVTVASVYFNAAGRLISYLATAAGGPTIGSALIVGLIATGQLRASAADALLAQCAGLFVVLTLVGLTRARTLAGIVERLKRRPNAEERELQSAFIRFASSIPFLAFASFVSLYGDRIAVARFFDLTRVGQYSYMFVLTMNIVNAGFGIYSASTFLRAAEELSHAEGTKRRIRAVNKFFWLSIVFPLCFVPLVSLYMVWDQEIVHLIFGAKAHVPHGLLPLAMIGAAFFGGGMQLSQVANLLKRQHELVIVRWGVVALMIAAMIAYHPSLYGICLDLVVANFIFYAVIGVLVRQKVREFSIALAPAT